jgi:hypothetical protein
LAEVGRTLHAKLDLRLTSIADELRSRDEELKLHNHNASYYALREQVYHCGELLKVARFRLSQKSEPRLDTAPGPSAVKRKSDGHRTASTKRFLREWIDEEDMRQTISEGQSESKYEQFSNRDLASQLSESLILASALVEAALTPRRWLVGIKLLTSDAEYQRRLEFHRSFNDYLALHGMMDAPSLLPLVAGCLKYRFQYEVVGEVFNRGYYLVSGISLIGLLGPLLGTYQTQVKHQASHLRSLHAIPVAGNPNVEELNKIILAQSVASNSPELQSPPEQLQPSDVIRGSIGREIVDYVSGSRCLSFSSENWTRSEVNQERFRRWWMQCMPIPPELRAVRNAPDTFEPIDEGATS